MFFGLFRRRSREAERKTYCEIVAQARQPAFYTAFGVPDTIDGRFDMIVLHAILLFRRLSGEGDKVSEFSQEVFDIFFSDMDASLREMGVTDTRVPKKVKVMGEAFYGRADAYAPFLEAKDVSGLSDAISRNLFPENPDPLAERALAHYMIAAEAELSGQDTEQLVSGEINWPDPQDFQPPR